jgi:hypothetical protein
MTNYELNEILKSHFAKYTQIWDDVLMPNQAQIFNTTDYKEKQLLQATQDKLAVYINTQSNLVEFLVKELAKAPQKSELDYYKRYAKQARYYIKNLGGNPSILNHITDADLC